MKFLKEHLMCEVTDCNKPYITTLQIEDEGVGELPLRIAVCAWHLASFVKPKYKRI